MTAFEGPFDTNTEALLSRILLGGRAMGAEAITVSGDNIATLTRLADSSFASEVAYACIICEAPAAPDSMRSARFTEVAAEDFDGKTLLELLNGQGLPLGHMGVYEVKGKANLENFRIKAVSGSIELRVQYFG
jgi:hypothetical protein